jgi:hypothetical protein
LSRARAISRETSAVSNIGNGFSIDLVSESSLSSYSGERMLSPENKRTKRKMSIDKDIPMSNPSSSSLRPSPSPIPTTDSNTSWQQINTASCASSKQSPVSEGVDLRGGPVKEEYTQKSNNQWNWDREAPSGSLNEIGIPIKEELDEPVEGFQDEYVEMREQFELLLHEKKELEAQQLLASQRISALERKSSVLENDLSKQTKDSAALQNDLSKRTQLVHELDEKLKTSIIENRQIETNLISNRQEYLAKLAQNSKDLKHERENIIRSYEMKYNEIVNSDDKSKFVTQQKQLEIETLRLNFERSTQHNKDQLKEVEAKLTRTSNLHVSANTQVIQQSQRIKQLVLENTDAQKLLADSNNKIALYVPPVPTLATEPGALCLKASLNCSGGVTDPALLKYLQSENYLGQTYKNLRIASVTTLTQLNVNKFDNFDKIYEFFRVFSIWKTEFINQLGGETEEFLDSGLECALAKARWFWELPYKERCQFTPTNPTCVIGGCLEPIINLKVTNALLTLGVAKSVNDQWMKETKDNFGNIKAPAYSDCGGVLFYILTTQVINIDKTVYNPNTGLVSSPKDELMNRIFHPAFSGKNLYDDCNCWFDSINTVGRLFQVLTGTLEQVFSIFKSLVNSRNNFDFRDSIKDDIDDLENKMRGPAVFQLLEKHIVLFKEIINETKVHKCDGTYTAPLGFRSSKIEPALKSRVQQATLQDGTKVDVNLPASVQVNKAGGIDGLHQGTIPGGNFGPQNENSNTNEPTLTASVQQLNFQKKGDKGKGKGGNKKSKVSSGQVGPDGKTWWPWMSRCNPCELPWYADKCGGASPTHRPYRVSNPAMSLCTNFCPEIGCKQGTSCPEAHAMVTPIETHRTKDKDSTLWQCFSCGQFGHQAGDCTICPDHLKFSKQNSKN